jgi:hypothetical protein
MRTARAFIYLAPGVRPRALATVVEAQHELTRVSDGAKQTSPVRFAGYQPADTDLRCAVYEADYADA